MKDNYTKILADHISVSIEDLTPTEVSLINKSYDIFNGRLEDIKALNDEVKRLSLELANLKAMGTIDDARYEEKQTGVCPVCGRDESFRNDY